MPTTADYEEIVRCGKDPEYFLKKYAKIQHARRGLIPFATYPFQDDCLQSFKEHRFNIVLKSRQLGLSTITAGYCAWLALYYRDKNILVIATKLATAMEFTKKVKVMLESVPKNLRLTDFTMTKTTITFSNGSVITAIPTSPDAGRSQALSLLVIDECAWIKDFDHIWTGLAPTLSTGGAAILLSTPNGVGGQYYKIWTDGEAKQNDFNTIKLPWHVHPEHDQDWFDKETRNLSKRKVAQEYECVSADTRITSINGFTRADEIAIGDLVLTHKGRFRKVLNVQSRMVDERDNICVVRAPGNRKNDVIITGNHPALVYEFRSNNLGGINAFMQQKDHLTPSFRPIEEFSHAISSKETRLNALFPKFSQHEFTNEMTKIDLSQLHETTVLSNTTCHYYRQANDTVRFIDVDYELGKFIGLALAEGCWQDTFLDLGFHIDEIDTHARFCLEFTQKFNVLSDIQDCSHTGKKACRWSTCNKYMIGLVRYFITGTGARNKMLNMHRLLQTNIDFIRGILHGHFLGDGNHSYTKKCCTYSTSEKLIHQLRTLYSAFSMYPRLGRIATSDPSKYTDIHYLEFYCDDKKFEDMFMTGNVVKRGSRIAHNDEYFVGHCQVTIENDRRADLIVYDIEVEDDHTFVASSIIVHNCSFESSGDTFLQKDEMEWLHNLIEEPDISGDIDRGLWIWNEPQPNTKYVIGADVSRGNSEDYSTAHVVDMDTLEVVAEYMGKLPADKFGDLLMKIGYKYNTALIAPENNNFGWFTACRIRDQNYPRLYYEKHKGDVYDYKATEAEEKPGFSTQTSSRQAILTKLESIIRNRQIVIHSSRTFEQLRTFVWINNKAVAMRDAHDDLVMSLAIAMWIAADDPQEIRSNDGSLEKAMMKASSVNRNSATSIIPDSKTMNLPYKHQIAGSDYLKPHDTERYRGFNPHDYRWLLK